MKYKNILFILAISAPIIYAIIFWSITFKQRVKMRKQLWLIYAYT